MALLKTKIDVPARALMFAGDVVTDAPAVPVPPEPQVDGQPTPPPEPQMTRIPCRITARTGGVANHPYWSNPTVHDFAGMVAPDKIPIDYGHDDAEVIGYADSIDTSTGNLILSGVLLSMAPGDRAAEVYAKAKEGVPYQASIVMGMEPLSVEEVGAGMSALVNGQTVDGPVTIFRAFQLRGVSILPHGADSDTNIEFGSKLGNASATVYRHEAAVPDKPKTGADYLAAFGDQGGVWFAMGKPWEDAQALYAKANADRTAKFEAEVARLNGVVAALKGGTPVSGAPAPTPEPTPAPAPEKKAKYEFGLPTGVARLAAANAARREGK